MARSRAFARYLFRRRHQKRYSFTKTKMILGFFFSLFTSIIFGTYLEAHGWPILKQAYYAISSAEQSPGQANYADSETKENPEETAP